MEINKGFNMRKIKEHDLLLLCSEPIEGLGDTYDIKRKVSAEFIRNTLIQQCSLFGLVYQKNMGSPKDPTQA